MVVVLLLLLLWPRLLCFDGIDVSIAVDVAAVADVAAAIAVVAAAVAVVAAAVAVCCCCSCCLLLLLLCWLTLPSSWSTFLLSVLVLLSSTLT